MKTLARLKETEQRLGDAIHRSGESDNNFQVSMLNEMIEHCRGSVQDCRGSVQDCRDLVKDYCMLLYERHNMIKQVLLEATRAGYKTDYQTANTNRSYIEKDLNQMDAIEETKNNEAPPSPSMLHTALINEQLEQCSVLSAQELFNKLGLDEKVINVLEEFYKFCNVLFSKSVPLTHEYRTPEYAQDI